MELIVRWGLAIAFTGVVIGLCAQFQILPREQKRTYAIWFIISVVLIGVGTLVQMGSM